MADNNANDAGDDHPEINHVLKTIQKGDFEKEGAVNSCIVYLQKLATYKCRRAKGYSTRQTDCNCLSFLMGNNDISINQLTRCAKYMVYWKSITIPIQNSMCKEWVKLAPHLNVAERYKNFALPMSDPESFEESAPIVFICRNALFAILNVGRKRIVTITRNVTFQHALTNKTGSRSSKGKYADKTYGPSLSIYFANLKEEGAPFATRQIRELAGLTYRDEDPDDVYLPPHMSKRRMYEKWCWEQGWIAKKKVRATSQYVNTEQYDKRPNDDDAEWPLWPSSQECKQVCAWPTFWKYWVDNYPNIKVRAKGADTPCSYHDSNGILL